MDGNRSNRILRWLCALALIGLLVAGAGPALAGTGNAKTHASSKSKHRTTKHKKHKKKHTTKKPPAPCTTCAQNVSGHFVTASTIYTLTASRAAGAPQTSVAGTLMETENNPPGAPPSSINAVVRCLDVVGDRFGLVYGSTQSAPLSGNNVNNDGYLYGSVTAQGKPYRASNVVQDTPVTPLTGCAPPTGPPDLWDGAVPITGGTLTITSR